MISKVVNRDIDTVFDWYYHSENFTASPIVFKSKWREPKYWEKGAIRDIVMIARWYNEEITKVVTVKRSIIGSINLFLPSNKILPKLFLSLSMITRQKSHRSLI